MSADRSRRGFGKTLKKTRIVPQRMGALLEGRYPGRFWRRFGMLGHWRRRAQDAQYHCNRIAPTPQKWEGQPTAPPSYEPTRDSSPAVASPATLWEGLQCDPAWAGGTGPPARQADVTHLLALNWANLRLFEIAGPETGGHASARQAAVQAGIPGPPRRVGRMKIVLIPDTLGKTDGTLAN